MTLYESISFYIFYIRPNVAISCIIRFCLNLSPVGDFTVEASEKIKEFKHFLIMINLFVTMLILPAPSLYKLKLFFFLSI